MGVGKLSAADAPVASGERFELGDREDARVRPYLNPNLVKLVSRAGRNSGGPLFRYLRTVR